MLRTMSELAAVVGDRVRSARAERGLSLGALARAAGVGKGSLSEIEHGARNPTIGTLYALAGALGVPLATLLADRVGAEVGSPGFVALLLDVHEAGGMVVEVYRLSFAAGAERRSDAHPTGVTEHLLVTAGRLRVGLTADPRDLGPGEVLRWEGDGPHAYAALDGSPAEAVLVIRSPRPA